MVKKYGDDGAFDEGGGVAGWKGKRSLDPNSKNELNGKGQAEIRENEKWKTNFKAFVTKSI